MRNRVCITIVLLLTIASVFGEGYSYVCDTDLYALVRKQPQAGSPVVDTVYHFQVVATGEDRNGWVETFTANSSGWVHSSRLRPLPQDVAGNMDGLFHSSGYGCVFIAGADVPYIALFLHTRRFSLPEGKLYSFGDNGTSLDIIVEEGAAAYDMRTRVQLWEWDFPTYCQRAEVRPGRIMVYDEFGVTSFFRNLQGETCRMILPLYSYRSYPHQDVQSVLDIAEKLLHRCEGLDEVQAREISRDMIGVSNFELLDKLRTAFLMGDQRGLWYYPAVLRIADCDGSDCHGLDYLYTELTVIQNTGVMTID